jgi:hypothetical protein
MASGGTGARIVRLMSSLKSSPSASLKPRRSRVGCPVPDRRAGQAEVFMGLVDDGKIRIERALVYQAFCAQVAHVHEHHTLQRGQVLARTDVIGLRQDGHTRWCRITQSDATCRHRASWWKGGGLG